MIAYKDGRVTLIQGDSRSIELPDESVQCVVTSPPYWGLRDYGVEGQLGLESTPEEYVANMVQVFSEVRRVLRDDGTLWLNLGDSYAGGGKGYGGADHGKLGPHANEFLPAPVRYDGIKPKDLVGIPWRVAFALQADGWWLRSACPWVKGNAMPESVRDRPTAQCEYIFLLTKSKRYYYDYLDVKVPAKGGKTRLRRSTDWYTESLDHLIDIRQNGGMMVDEDGFPISFNVNTTPYKGPHYATFPPNLVRPMILAGTSAWGCCPTCGAPWERMVEKGEFKTSRGGEPFCAEYCQKMHGKADLSGVGMTSADGFGSYERTTTGWRPTCDCFEDRYSHDAGHYTVAPAPTPCTVLDPFAGTSTVGEVCLELDRKFVGVEIGEDNIELSKERMGL